MAPGGVLCAYVATTTQLSRIVEALREHGGFAEPQPWESHGAWLARRRARGAPGAPDDRPHRLPGHLATAGPRRHGPAEAAAAGEGRTTR